MNNEKIPQPEQVGEKMLGIPIPEHRDGWMSANAIAKSLERGLGDKVVWKKSGSEGIPDTRKKFQAIVSAQRCTVHGGITAHELFSRKFERRRGRRTCWDLFWRL